MSEEEAEELWGDFFLDQEDGYEDGAWAAGLAACKEILWLRKENKRLSDLEGYLRRVREPWRTLTQMRLLVQEAVDFLEPTFPYRALDIERRANEIEERRT